MRYRLIPTIVATLLVLCATGTAAPARANTPDEERDKDKDRATRANATETSPRKRAGAKANKNAPEVANLVIEVPFEPDETTLGDRARKRLQSAATWATAASNRRLILVAQPDREDQPPEIAAARSGRALEFLESAGASPEQVSDASSGKRLELIEPSEDWELRYVMLVERRFDAATRAERRDKRRERRAMLREHSRVAGESVAPDIGYALFLGAGVLDYLSSDTRAATSLATSWSATLVARTRQRVATELTYVGAVQNLEDASSTTLVTSLLEGAFRLQSRELAGFWRPYAFAGAGFGFVAATSEPPGMETLETVLYAPVGAGMVFSYEDLRLDLRAVVRAVVLDDLQAQPEPADALGLDHWQMSARLGWHF